MIDRACGLQVAFMFGPAMLVWFVTIGVIGLFNIVRWDTTVFKALNPYYAVSYFTRNGYDAWASLGGVVLCITGKFDSHPDLWKGSQILTAYAHTIFKSR